MARPRTFLDSVGGVPSGYDWQQQMPVFHELADAFSASHPAGVTAPPVTAASAAPSVVAPPVVSGQGPGHWVMPNYEALIRSDPGFMAAQAIHDATVGADPTAGPLARSRAASIRKALVDFGLIPQSFHSGYGDVDPATVAAAGQNPFSLFSGLNQARSRGSADLAAVLGARGVLSSGALTGGENMLQRNYDEASARGTRDLLSALGGFEGDYASGVQGAENALTGARGEAAGRVQQQYPATWVVDPATGQVTQSPAGTAATTATAPTDPAVTAPTDPVLAGSSLPDFEGRMIHPPISDGVSPPPVPVAGSSLPDFEGRMRTPVAALGTAPLPLVRAPYRRVNRAVGV